MCVYINLQSFFNNNVLECINEMFILNIGKYNTRNLSMLKRPLYKTPNGQKAISYIDPMLWDSISNYLKEKKKYSYIQT